MLLFGTSTAGLYVFFAVTPITYVTLLVAVVLLTTSFLFVASAQNGLTSMIGQQHAMSGQISAVWNIFASVPTVAPSSSAALSATCSKRGTPIRPVASYFSSALRLWPRLPFTPRGSPEACLATSVSNTGPRRIR